MHRVVSFTDENGKTSQILLPFGIEFHPRDFLQVIVGACILALPVSFSEEIWILSKEIPLINTILIIIFSILFISLFVYFNFYRFHFKQNIKKFIKRVFFIYLGSLIVSGIILTLLNLAPWKQDILTVFKRIILISFPSSMSAAVTDTLK